MLRHTQIFRLGSLLALSFVAPRVEAQDPTPPPAWGEAARPTGTPTGSPAGSPHESPSTAAVYRMYSSGVLKIQVIERGSAAKASFGSGFFVSADGTIVTNYHVIAKIVNDPTRYRADATDAHGTVSPVTVVAVDVVHDLAILHSTARPTRWFTLDNVTVDQGDRLYSMGHPRDLGLSVVEGTYNGLLAHTLYPKIHFTGSINPGMSGGPAMTGNGQVVGVNVATAGDGIGFLVPIREAQKLIARSRLAGSATPDSLLADVGRQIRAYQDAYLKGMFLPNSPTTRLGRYTVPTRPAEFFKCWADAWDTRETAFRMAMHQCSTDDELFISDEQTSGVVEMEHRFVTTPELSPSQFRALLSSQFGGELYSSGTEEEVTRYSCQTRNVTNGTTKLRVAFCARAYRKLPGLYDAIVRVATLGATNTGVVSTLRLSGVTYKNAQTLANRYLQSIVWNP